MILHSHMYHIVTLIMNGGNAVDGVSVFTRRMLISAQPNEDLNQSSELATSVPVVALQV